MLLLTYIFTPGKKGCSTLFFVSHSQADARTTVKARVSSYESQAPQHRSFHRKTRRQQEAFRNSPLRVNANEINANSPPGLRRRIKRQQLSRAVSQLSMREGGPAREETIGSLWWRLNRRPLSSVPGGAPGRWGAFPALRRTADPPTCPQPGPRGFPGRPRRCAPLPGPQSARPRLPAGRSGALPGIHHQRASDAHTRAPRRRLLPPPAPPTPACPSWVCICITRTRSG